MKKILLMLISLLMGIPAGLGAAPAIPLETVFAGVKGEVTVLDVKGNSRIAQKNSEAYSGETVRIGNGGNATLRVFDGSKLELKSNTRLEIDDLKRPSEKGKNIRFSLMMGGVRAMVRELMTSSSTFEIEAGGVVCGVRGTEFTVDYDPGQEKVDLKVIRGNVYAKTEGKEYRFKAGEGMEFIKRHPGNRPVSGMSISGKKTAAVVSPAINGAGSMSLALEDLNSQFTQGFSINGTSLVPHSGFGASIQSSFQLTSLAPVLSGGGSLLAIGIGKGTILHLP